MIDPCRRCIEESFCGGKFKCLSRMKYDKYLKKKIKKMEKDGRVWTGFRKEK